MINHNVPMQPASLDIWDKKYRLKDYKGAPIDETIQDTYDRVATALANVELTEEKRVYWRGKFLEAMKRGVIPAGRITSNAGAGEHKPATSLVNCTVANHIIDSMDDIMHSVHDAALTLKAGCGIGYSFSTLRPKGAYVAGAGANTSGPLSFMDVFDKMCFTVASAGGRRGAQMGTFDVSHPDVRDFIKAKREDGRLRQFNLSLLITDDFIKAVEGNQEWALVFPVHRKEKDDLDLNDPSLVQWREWPIHKGYIVREDGLVACKVYDRIPARRLWDMIMSSTYDYAEPGFILIDRVNADNNNWWCENIQATNPCGEQPLPEYGSCWTGDMRLMTNHGLIRTEEAFERAQRGEPLMVAVDDVFSKSGTDLRPCEIVVRGKKKVLEIRCKNGQKIELTEDHRVYTPEGWVEAGKLQVGGKIHAQSRALSGMRLLPDEYLGFLKYFFDKHVVNGSLVITKQSHQRALRPLLAALSINFSELNKGGIYLPVNHPVMLEVRRLSWEQLGEAGARGRVAAAQATSAVYKGHQASYLEDKETALELAAAIEAVTNDKARVCHHGKGTWRVVHDAAPIALQPLSEVALDLESALFGWLLTDGWLTSSTGVLFSTQDDIAQELIGGEFARMTGTNGKVRVAYEGQSTDLSSLACWKKSAVETLKGAMGLDCYRSKNIRVPEPIFKATMASQASFLSAAFCADGSVDQDGGSVRLTSASRTFLEDVQLLLLNFGIHTVMHEGISKGNVFYSLNVRDRDAYAFFRHIGFRFNSTKQEKLRAGLQGKSGWNLMDVHQVEEISFIREKGEEVVYDIEEFSTNTLIVNGLVVHNCLLGSINLTSFVRHPFTDEASFDWEGYGETVRVFTRMLDNVVEINGLPLEQQRHEIFSKRRHGMGFLGLGSASTMLRMPYGSAKSVQFAEEVTKVLAIEGWKMALELAKEKGPAPLLAEEFDVTAEMLRKRPEMAADGWKIGQKIRGSMLHARYSHYMQRIAAVEPELVAELAEVGARFTHHSSIAPTGTISLSLANNASNGIEPSFAHHYSRNVIREGKKSKEKVDVYSYELLAYRELVNENAMPFSEDPSSKLPAYFISADDVTPKQHVDMQAASQKWIDSSISKTANVPTDYPYEDFKDIYLYAYHQGLKGCTTFRFNPAAFQGVLVKESDLENTTYRFELEDGTVLELKGNEEVFYDGEKHSAANLFDALKEGYYGKF